MTVKITPVLKQALVLDAAVSGAAAILMIGGATILSPLTGLPSALLFWAGIVLVPFVATLVFLARSATASRLMLVDTIALNMLWVAASIGVLAGGFVEPNALGMAYVLAQAAAVALFAYLQARALGQARLAAA